MRSIKQIHLNAIWIKQKKKNQKIEFSDLVKNKYQGDDKKLINLIDELVDSFFMYDIN